MPDAANPPDLPRAAQRIDVAETYFPYATRPFKKKRGHSGKQQFSHTGKNGQGQQNPAANGHRLPQEAKLHSENHTSGKRAIWGLIVGPR